MSTTTEATEGQVKIRELLEQALDQAPQCTCSEAYTSRGMAAPDCAGCDAFAMIQLVRDALAELEAPSPPSSPPIVGELTEEEIERITLKECPSIAHLPQGDHLLHLHGFQRGLRYARDHGYLAQAPQSSLAPKHLNLEDEARVWYGDNYDYVTASNQHAIRMLAAFASHVLALSPSAQGVTVDQIFEVFDEAVEASIEHGDEDEAQDWFDIKDVGVELRTRLSALLTK